MSNATAPKPAPKTTAADKDPLDADFTYLQTVEPGEVAALHAALISELSGVEISPRQVRAVLSMHGKIQRSEANRKRAGYVPRTAQSIRNGGATTVERMDLRLRTAPVSKIPAKAPAKKAAPAKPQPPATRTPRKTAAPKPKAEPVELKVPAGFEAKAS